VKCHQPSKVLLKKFNENDVVPIGTAIAKIRVGASSAVTSSTPTPTPQPQYEEAKVVEEIPYMPVGNQQSAIGNTQSSSGKIRFYSPLVLNIAQQEGISMATLETIEGTGQDGRVSKKFWRMLLIKELVVNNKQHLQKPNK
jgi:2-oxoglutarate dehydrogenase E2 component (dihydrolipoamide succinyltransferase)